MKFRRWSRFRFRSTPFYCLQFNQLPRDSICIFILVWKDTSTPRQKYPCTFRKNSHQQSCPKRQLQQEEHSLWLENCIAACLVVTALSWEVETVGSSPLKMRKLCTLPFPTNNLLCRKQPPALPLTLAVFESNPNVLHLVLNSQYALGVCSGRHLTSGPWVYGSA